MRGQSRSTRKKTKGTISSPQLSRTHKPEHLSLEEWQRALRRQYGRAQKFIWRNLGNEPVFSDYVVTNPITKNSYQVIIRGTRSGDNHCTCPDFSVNTLGTCKHIEFVLGRLERKAGKRALAAAYVPPFSEIFLRYGAKREVVFSLGAECPIELKKLLPDLFDKNGVLLEGAYQHFHRFLSQAAATGHEIRCRDDAMAFVAEKRDHENRRRQLENFFPRGADSPYFRNLLKTDLFPYQRQGALFAASAARCLIGDEMGLGKTIQAIAAAEILAREFGIERVLVICPTSLKYQWKQEIERFANRTVAIVEGPAPTRKQALTSEAFFKIINYDIVYRELDLLRQWSPDLIILDEAQRIKNWKTRTAQSVKRLSSQFALVLTGTPLENRLEELYSIIEFIDRFRLGPMFQFLHRHQMQDDGGKIVGYRNLDQISQTLAPILIRRTKEQVALQLPKRVEINISCQ